MFTAALILRVSNSLIVIINRIKCGVSIGINLTHDAVHENPDTRAYRMHDSTSSPKTDKTKGRC